ncbi:MAG: hypothetical protein AB7I36_08425 [Rhodospirillaceae bacterium]
MNQPLAQSAPDPYATHTFDRLIATHEGGELNADLSKKLNETVAFLENFVQTHGGKPEASLGVSFKIKKDGQMIQINAEVSEKLPKEPRNSGMYFADAKNRLTKRDPKQIEMFTDVSRPAAAPVSIG